MSDSVWPHRWQPTRLCCPWDSPGKNTGVGCHFLLQYMKVKSESEVAQSCPTLSDPMDCSLPSMGFSRKEYWSGLPLPSLFELLDLYYITNDYSNLNKRVVMFIHGKLGEMVKDREAWHAAVHGVTKSWTWLNDETTTTMFILIVNK